MTTGPVSDRAFLRFVIVGAGFAGLYAVLAALATSHVPLPKALSSALIWILCVPISFWCHRHFTFPGRAAHRHGLWLYAATQVLGVSIAAGTSHLLATGAFVPDLFVHILASVLAALASYALNRRFTFPSA